MSRASSPAPRQANAAAPAPAAKKVLGVEDYGRWRTIDDERMSPDGRWVAYFTDQTHADAKKLSDAKKPVPCKLGLMNLRTGEKETSKKSGWHEQRGAAPPS